jgi:hypothetical protein
MGTSYIPYVPPKRRRAEADPNDIVQVVGSVVIVSI